MSIKDILAKVAKGETLTDEEKSALGAYDPQAEIDKASAAARRKAEKERDDFKAQAEKSAADLAVDLAGDDPMGWIASRIGAYWARHDEAKIINILKGIFATGGAGANLVYDISGGEGDAALLGKDTLIWAAQKLGDKKANLTAVAMNSVAEAFLASLDAQSTLYRPSDAKGTLPTYNGKAIVMDDNLAYDSFTKVAEIYLFGAGAVALNDVPSKNGFEAGRDPLKNGGEDYVVSRHANVAHVRGFKWTANTCTGATPSNAELATAANWAKVYDDKDIRVVKLVCKLG